MNRVCVDGKTAIYTFSNIHNLNQLFKVEISPKQSSKVKAIYIFTIQLVDLKKPIKTGENISRDVTFHL